MKGISITIVAILLILLGLGALVVIGPLKAFLPQGTQDEVEAIMPDYFRAERSPGGEGGIVTRPSDRPETPVARPQTWTLTGLQGTQLVVLRFVATSTDEVPPQENTDLIGSFKEKSPFIITYVARDQSFNIGLFAEPLGETRKAAEQYLIQKLGLSEREMCFLRASVVTPYWVNSFYSGKNLGFSFCPGTPQF